MWGQPPSAVRRAKLDRTCRLLQIYGFLQRQTLRRPSHHEAVISRKQLPAILFNIEDGEIFWVYFDRDIFAFPSVELDFAPAHQTFRRLSGLCRKGSVHFRYLRPGAVARVLDREAHLRILSRRYLEIRVGVGGIRKAIPEWKQHRFIFGVVPFVT